MKKLLGVVITTCGLLLLACVSQTPPTITATTVLEPTAILEPSETPPVFGSLPTVTLPPHTLAPVPTLTPLPSDAFDHFDKLAGYCMIKTRFGEVMSGSLVEEQILSDLSVGKIWFSLYWSEGDLDLTLVQPDGTLLDPSILGENNGIREFTSEHGSEKYSILAPQVGTWRARIFGASTSPTRNPYMLEIWSMDATMISIQFDKKEYSPGDAMKIVTNLHDTDMVVENNRDVSIQVIAEDPTRRRFSFDLYDDGTHGDEKGGDGVFTNMFEQTFMEGAYKFYFKMSGRNQKIYYENNDPQNPTYAPFERECFMSTNVTK